MPPTFNRIIDGSNPSKPTIYKPLALQYNSLMHSKVKGSLGELKTMAHILGLGYPVFFEYGDSSKVDLITIVDSKVVTIQVKAFKSSSGKVSITNRSSGPGYRYVYKDTDVDVFAVYVPDKDILLFINSKVLCSSENSSVTIRLEDSKNGQLKKVRKKEDYIDFLKSFEE